MLNIPIPIIVEGKYDRLRLLSVVNAKIIQTDGFRIFSKKDMGAMLRRLARERGIIVLTDSDGGGLVIRNYLRSILPEERVYHVYVPQIKGKEKRKKEPSKQGFLGVEGMEREIIEKALAPYASEGKISPKMNLSKADLYELGLSGGSESVKKREALASLLELPIGLSASALLEAINLTVDENEFSSAIEKIGKLND